MLHDGSCFDILAVFGLYYGYALNKNIIFMQTVLTSKIKMRLLVLKFILLTPSGNLCEKNIRIKKASETLRFPMLFFDFL